MPRVREANPGATTSVHSAAFRLPDYLLPDYPITVVTLSISPPERLSCERDRTMKFVCLGYIAPGKFESIPETERNAFIDTCWAYDD